MNLIDNAWKYGGGEVTVKTAAVNGEIWLEISDHGTGIPATEKWTRSQIPSGHQAADGPKKPLSCRSYQAAKD